MSIFPLGNFGWLKQWGEKISCRVLATVFQPLGADFCFVFSGWFIISSLKIN
jgi:hypothetical protein